MSKKRNVPQYIPITKALPTHGYVIAFFVVTVILYTITEINTNATIESINEKPFVYINEAEASKMLNLARLSSFLSSFLAIIIGILLNVICRYKTWCWRWLLLYILTSTAFCVGVGSLISGELTAGSVGLVWWIVIMMYRVNYINGNLVQSPQPNAQSQCHCSACGNVLEPNAHFCGSCGAAANVQPPVGITNAPISTVDRPAVNSSPINKAQKNYTLESIISAYNLFEKNTTGYKIADFPTFKTTIEAKALFSFLHYLDTRDEQYAPLNTEEYEKAFAIKDEEKSLFNQRLCDYLEIDLNGIVLPFEHLLSKHKQHGSCEKHSRYFYAFAIFLASDETYAKINDIAMLSKLTETTFKHLSSVYCAKIAYEEAQKAYNTL